jgi:hypothetical protein
MAKTAHRPSVPRLEDLAERAVRKQVQKSLQELKFQDASSKRDVDDALFKLPVVFGVKLRDDVHDALVRMQTIDLSTPRILFRRGRSVFDLLNRTYVLPHKDCSQSNAPGFWAASNVLKRRIESGDLYNAFDLQGLTLVSLEGGSFDHDFIYDCPSVFKLLVLKLLPTDVIRYKMQVKHDKARERIAEMFKGDQVGVDERLSRADALFVSPSSSSERTPT